MRRLAPLLFTNPRAAELSRAQHNRSRRAIAHFAPLVSSLRFPRKLHQPVPSARIHSELRQTMFCFLEDACTGYHVFSTEPLTQTAIPEKLQWSSTSPAQSASVITTTEPCGVARNTRNIKIATNVCVACRISNQIFQQTLYVDFITSGSCADVSGQIDILRS